MWMGRILGKFLFVGEERRLRIMLLFFLFISYINLYTPPVLLSLSLCRSHNLPDGSGNRYCINLVSVAGRPE